MIKDSDKKLFDIVLVWKLDRFARNRYDSARYKTQLKKNGVKLMSAMEIISEGPEGIILESVLEGYAEYYSADLAEKVVRGQIQNMLNAIQAGILTSSTKERLEQLEETKRELEARIAEEKLAKPKVTEEFIRLWLLRFRKLDMSLKDQRQALVDTFIYKEDNVPGQ